MDCIEVVWVGDAVLIVKMEVVAWCLQAGLAGVFIEMRILFPDRPHMSLITLIIRSVF
jgi:hypothetical protein